LTSEDQEFFRKLIVELRILENTAANLQTRMNFINGALTELMYAQMTLIGVEKEKSDASLFMPIGGGSYVKAKLESTEKVIVGIGAGVSIEKGMTEAKQNVQDRITGLQKTRVSLQQQLVQVVNKIQEDRERLQELDVKLRPMERANIAQKVDRWP
jgi:prefoldin alpha subunit